ncbi:MAG: hypothetical protein WCK29_04155 [archaeon]
MVYTSIFSSALGQLILAFVLIFTLVFAVLQKSKILGDGKKQIDALIALAIALIVISVGSVLDFIQHIIPFMAIGLVIILVFMILMGAVFADGTLKEMPWLKWVFAIVILVAVIVAVLVFTKGWDYILSFFSSDGSWAGNLILIVIIVLAIVFSYFGKDK